MKTRHALMRHATDGIVGLGIVASLLAGFACSSGGDENIPVNSGGPVYIESISPESGTIGTEVVIRGHGFDSRENDIGLRPLEGGDFNGSDTVYQNGVPSPDGEMLRFELEREDSLAFCPTSQTGACDDIGFETPLGELIVTVANSYGTSNGVPFDRQVSPMEEAEETIYGSPAYQEMSRRLEDVVRLSGNPGGPYAVSAGIGIRESEDGEIYLEVEVSGMADSELRDIVPDQIEEYEVVVTKHPPPSY